MEEEEIAQPGSRKAARAVKPPQHMSEYISTDLAVATQRRLDGSSSGSFNANGTAPMALDTSEQAAAPPAASSRRPLGSNSRSARSSASASASTASSSANSGASGSASTGPSVPNHDYCESCDLGGSLLCCDRCPNSFHLTCLDPPLSAVPEGDWFCSFCTRGKQPPPPPPARTAKDACQALMEQLAVSHPRVFWPPRQYRSAAKAEGSAGPPDDDSSDGSESGSSHNGPEDSAAARFRDFERGRERSGGSSSKKRRPNECAECHQAGANTDLAHCVRCKKAYHLWCLDPPLAAPPLRDWFCPSHEGYLNQRAYVLASRTIRLDFAPVPAARDDRRKPPRTFRTTRGPQRGPAAAQPVFVTAPPASSSSPPVAAASAADKAAKETSKDAPATEEADEQADEGLRPAEYVVALAQLQQEMERADVKQFGPGETFLARRRQERRQRALEQTQEELLDLHFLQAQLLPLALPASVNGSAAGGAAARSRAALEVPPSVVSQLSPLMVQFLAWQRLVELHEQIRTQPPLPMEMLQTAGLALPPPAPVAHKEPSRPAPAQSSRAPAAAASSAASSAAATSSASSSSTSRTLADARRPAAVASVAAASAKAAPLGPPPPRAAAAASRAAAAAATAAAAAANPPAAANDRKRKPPEPRAPPAKRGTAAASTSAAPLSPSPTPADAGTVPSSPATPTPAVPAAVAPPPPIPAPVVVPTGGDPPPRIAFLTKGLVMYQFDNKREIRIGRKKVPEPGQPNPDINLVEIEPGQGAVVSRNHALIFWSPTDKAFKLRNYGRNGTSVNSKKYYGEEEVLLHHGAKVRIGKNSFVIQIANQPLPDKSEDKEKDADSKEGKEGKDPKGNGPDGKGGSAPVV